MDKKLDEVVATFEPRRGAFKLVVTKVGSDYRAYKKMGGAIEPIFGKSFKNLKEAADYLNKSIGITSYASVNSMEEKKDDVKNDSVDLSLYDVRGIKSFMGDLIKKKWYLDPGERDRNLRRMREANSRGELKNLAKGWGFTWKKDSLDEEKKIKPSFNTDQNAYMSVRMNAYRGDGGG